MRQEERALAQTLEELARLLGHSFGQHKQRKLGRQEGTRLFQKSHLRKLAAEEGGTECKFALPAARSGPPQVWPTDGWPAGCSLHWPAVKQQTRPTPLTLGQAARRLERAPK